MPVNDSSDWWSILRREEDPNGPEIKIKPNNKPIDDSNLQIAGVALGENQFSQLAAKLGKAAEIERGDAASGRHQVCYQSDTGAEKVHLIFEFGEVETIFYLFAGGQDWNGSNVCLKSKLVSSSVSTPSGLKLGLERSQVETILGPPDAASGERIFYSRQARKKTSPEEFEKMRNEYPEKLSDQEAHKKFDFYDEGLYIEIKFEDLKLTYLAVSKDDG